jgi:hypothetical protein
MGRIADRRFWGWKETVRLVFELSQKLPFPHRFGCAAVVD